MKKKFNSRLSKLTGLLDSRSLTSPPIELDDNHTLSIHTLPQLDTNESDLDSAFDSMSIKSQDSIQTPIKTPKSSFSGPSSWIPIGDLSEKQRGRFIVVREQVESSYWAPKTQTLNRPSRFHQ